MSGLSAGVIVADDPPLSSVRESRPAICSRGDGVELFGSPASGGLSAHCFPLTMLAHNSSTSLRWYRRMSSLKIVRRSAFPVAGFSGIRLHCIFLLLHSEQGPVGAMMQAASDLMQFLHCHILSAPSRMRGVIAYL